MLEKLIEQLPANTKDMSTGLLNHLDILERSITGCEEGMKREFGEDSRLKLFMSLPGDGFILGTIILSETGDLDRFPSAEKYASYCETTPRVKASGGKVWYGRLRKDCNHYIVPQSLWF